MEIRLENDKNSWKNDFFAQSWEWGNILIAEGKKVERLSVLENGAVMGVAQVVYSQLPFGWQYAFCPKGPNAVKNEAVYTVLALYLKEKNCLFFRFEPVKAPEASAHNYALQTSIDINPRTTTVLDLSQSEDELLAAMHQKTRYNIRLAEKKDLKIVAEKNYPAFVELMKKTGERDGFRLHEEKHYRVIFDSDFSRQLTVQQAGKNIATAVFVGSGDTFTYLYGASDHEYRSLMAPYLLQWEGIKLGKKLGYEKYDFFGIAPSIQGKTDEYTYDPAHQYAGVTRFKLGFGGIVVAAPGTFDLILRPVQYRVYQLLRRLRRLV